MKNVKLYAVDVLSNTVTVTKKFLDNASDIKSEEFKLYKEFKTLGFTIIQKTRSAKKESNSPLRPLKPSEEKKPLIPFEKMAQYISLLDDADEMMDEFDVVRSIAKSEEHPRKYVNEWFREQFPNYGKIAKLDDNNRIVHKNIA